MGEIICKDNKTLKLSNALIFEVKLNYSNIESIVSQMDNYIKSKGALSIGRSSRSDTCDVSNLYFHKEKILVLVNNKKTKPPVACCGTEKPRKTALLAVFSLLKAQLVYGILNNEM